MEFVGRPQVNTTAVTPRDGTVMSREKREEKKPKKNQKKDQKTQKKNSTKKPHKKEI